jgi:hypothetical protein
VRDELSEVIGEFSRVPHDGVKLYDFGDGILAAPLLRGDTYLTTRICYLYIEGKDNLKEGTLLSPFDKVLDFGNGWLFFGVEMKLGMPPMELRDKLAEGTNKLLEAARGKQMDAAGV